MWCVDLIPGDSLKTSSGWTDISSIERQETSPTPVYNLHVAHAAHTYYAGGVVVHNIKIPDVP